MDINSLILIVCAAGVIQSIFLSVFILTSRRIQFEERFLLSLLLLAISLRLIKSIGWYFFDIEHQMFLNIGFAAHGFIGPLLVIYFAKKSNLLSSPLLQILICAPAFTLVATSPFLTLNNFWYIGGYKLLLYYTVFFLLLAGYYLWVIFKEKKIYFPWYRNLYFGVSIFCIAYFTNYVFGLNPYIVGPILYAIVIYPISFIIFTNREIFTPLGDRRKYKNINLTPDQIANHGHRISSVMDHQKPYLKSEFSLSELSDLTAIPKHLLSRFFSENLNQSFSDFTNGYRIEKAKELLTDPKFNNHKIAYIAYECGFNSLSSFNTAFRKNANSSPSEYKRMILSNS
ncbi:helix-turn-helix domain-containing protein [Ekhidna sp. To15]|uniref:helix-turn-helix domain-containing protein n=1 Tax=Ekhidna sp. To15 TaxID=3395267 RepID=UPI003F5222DC